MPQRRTNPNFPIWTTRIRMVGTCPLTKKQTQITRFVYIQQTQATTERMRTPRVKKKKRRPSGEGLVRVCRLVIHPLFSMLFECPVFITDTIPCFYNVRRHTFLFQYSADTLQLLSRTRGRRRSGRDGDASVRLGNERRAMTAVPPLPVIPSHCPDSVVETGKPTTSFTP